MSTKYVTLKDSNGDTLYPQAVATNLAPGSIDTTKLADDAVTQAKLAATTIFNTPNTSGNITLLDNAQDYEYLDIYGHESGNRKVSLRLVTPRIGNKFSLYGFFIGSSNTVLYWRGATYEITSTTTITKTTDTAQVEIKPSGITIAGGGTSLIYIDKIIGYK